MVGAAVRSLVAKVTQVGRGTALEFFDHPLPLIRAIGPRYFRSPTAIISILSLSRNVPNRSAISFLEPSSFIVFYQLSRGMYY